MTNWHENRHNKAEQRGLIDQAVGGLIVPAQAEGQRLGSHSDFKNASYTRWGFGFSLLRNILRKSPQLQLWHNCGRPGLGIVQWWGHLGCPAKGGACGLKHARNPLFSFEKTILEPTTVRRLNRVMKGDLVSALVKGDLAP